jgi:phenylpropionate dioxygenase-like ring-hydroxylating dioxygenase large terminal subunit
MIRNSWYVAGLSRNFKYKLEKKIITALPIVMWRAQDGNVVAFDGRCCHKRFPLWDGKLLDNGVLRCAYHGLCYDSSGKCIDIPMQRDIPISPVARLRRYPVVEQDGLVWVWPGDPEKIGTVKAPRIPELADPRYEAVISDPPIRIRANYRLLIENLLDITHFFPLHDGNIGDLANSMIPVGLVEDTIDGNPKVMTTRSVKNYHLPPYYQRWFGLDVVDRDHTHAMTGPGLVRVQLRLAPPGKLGTDDECGYILCHTDTPIDEQHLEWHWIMISKAGSRFPPDRSMTLTQGMAFEFPEVVAQDEWALAKQQEMLEFSDVFPDTTRYREINMRSDIGVVHARRVLSRMEKAESNEPFGLPPASLEMAKYAAAPGAQAAAAAEAPGAVR